MTRKQRDTEEVDLRLSKKQKTTPTNASPKQNSKASATFDASFVKKTEEFLSQSGTIREDTDVLLSFGALYSVPFQHGVLKSVFGQQFLSTDFEITQVKPLVKLRESLHSLAPVISKLMNVELGTTIDISGHKYPPMGFLACHDDDIGTDKTHRRVAFIVYLVDKDWNEGDGGRLNLFDADDNSQPSKIIKSIIPQWNTIAFFKVSPTSYHEVEEVLGRRDRVSVSGWFHGPPSEDTEADKEAKDETMSTTSADEEKSYPDMFSSFDWWLLINPAYQQQLSCEALISTFLDESSITLQNFLELDIANTIARQLVKCPFEQVGPPNRRRYSICESNSQPASNDGSVSVKRIHDWLVSPDFIKYLATMTSLDLSTTTPPSSECRKFKPGDYTLLVDDQPESAGLDLVLSFEYDLNDQIIPDLEKRGDDMAEDDEDEESPLNMSGKLNYVDGDETLASVSLKHNTLFMAYRVAGTSRFVRRISQLAKSYRIEFSLVYPVDDNDSASE
ncbi:hypothetical protein SmJEL517_g00236 [Synchytrium microbalum]|uniref:Fe2OG dioxygenase domain-containing protein n=1 Tax=Synchytrium microbalum TaxID=1806994 RepID=A0A507CEE2_9FUNG|nr:uncharacterized protein SmJEL517_g00236 [Synchytrium microbalum]TPX37992.1 hypothetical protein SmJEL517_g00236 [Synchytrium microbalum]